MSGGVIGKAGVVVNGIRRETGAQINISDEVLGPLEPPERDPS